MIAACERGEYDLIVTKSVSRFARNLVDCISLVRKLKRMNPPVGVYFETDNLNTLSEDSEFMLSFLATFAQEESVKKSESMNAVRWVKKIDPPEARKLTSKKLTDRLYDAWKWDRKRNYRSVGKLVTSGNKVMLLFDFSGPESWIKPEAKKS